MAIFNKSDKPASNLTNTTIIAAGTTMKGEIQIKSGIYVEGDFSGTINSGDIITVGKTGFVEGDIVSKKLIVTGRFSGTAYCEEIEILAGGKVVGQITSNILVIERGGFFEGESKPREPIKGSKSPPKEDSTVIAINSNPRVQDVG